MEKVVGSVGRGGKGRGGEARIPPLPYELRAWKNLQGKFLYFGLMVPRNKTEIREKRGWGIIEKKKL